MATNGAPHNDFSKIASKDGSFKRPASQFRHWISSTPGAEFPAERDRYVLYINRGCPWAHRANLVRSLKGLEDVVQLVVMDYAMGPEGWVFNPDRADQGQDPRDPLYGFTKLKELYLKADPAYAGRYTVPTLWDKRRETIVSNESAEIIRMFYSEFDEFVAEELSEGRKESGGLLPEVLKRQIDEMNGWVYDTINNGVYKCGFASSQAAYEENCTALFASLDRIEEIIGESCGPFIFGKHLTEADIRLFTTIVRFDVGYHTLFRCNLKMIRHDYPHIHRWLLHLFWDGSPEQTRGAFRATTDFEAIKHGYAAAGRSPVVPLGPVPSIMPKGSA